MNDKISVLNIFVRTNHIYIQVLDPDVNWNIQSSRISFGYVFHPSSLENNLPKEGTGISNPDNVSVFNSVLNPHKVETAVEEQKTVLLDCTGVPSTYIHPNPIVLNVRDDRSSVNIEDFL